VSQFKIQLGISTQVKTMFYINSLYFILSKRINDNFGKGRFSVLYLHETLDNQHSKFDKIISGNFIYLR